MKEKQIIQHGFKEIRNYNHDEWNTKVFKKGCIELDLTYSDKELESSTVSLDADDCIKINFDQLLKLDEILNAFPQPNFGNEDDFVPFGKEWKAEIMKMTKKDLVFLLEKISKENMALQAKLTQKLK